MAEPKKKYLIMPGKMMSKNDKDVHFITAEQLIRLYNVDRRECDIVKLDEKGLPILQGLDINKYIILGPRYDGNYQIPKIKPNEDSNSNRN